MVATWILVAGLMALLGAGAAGVSYFAGKTSAYKSVVENIGASGSGGFFSWISSMIFGDSLSGIFSNVIVLVIIAVIVFLLIKYFVSRRRQKTV